MKERHPIQITGQGVTITPAIKEMTEKKMAKLFQHNAQIMQLHIVFSIEKLLSVGQATLTLPRRPNIHAHEQTDDLYKTIDGLLNKLILQLNKQH